VRLEVTGEDQLRRLARDLRAQGPTGKLLRKRLRRRIIAAGKPMVRSAKENAHNIPAKGSRSTGLRDDLARATRMRVGLAARTSSVRVETTGKKMPSGKKALPKDMEGSQRWRHPVFGDRDVWVTQPPHPYFYRAVKEHLPEVRAGVMKAVEQTAAELERGR
jgi:hypothetical protein